MPGCQFHVYSIFFCVVGNDVVKKIGLCAVVSITMFFVSNIYLPWGQLWDGIYLFFWMDTILAVVPFFFAMVKMFGMVKEFQIRASQLLVRTEILVFALESLHRKILRILYHILRLFMGMASFDCESQ